MAFNISYVYEVLDRASAPLKKIARSQKKVASEAVKAGEKIKAASKKSEKAVLSLSEVAGRAAGIMAAAFALALPIRQAIDFEAAMSDVAKVVEFKEPDGLKKMGIAIKNLAKELPVTQTGLADIVAAGGQLGVPAEKLEDFATLAAKMSIAFDILPGAAGAAMAKLSNIFDVPIDEMEQIGDAINFVSNNAAASAGEIVTALQKGAGAGGRALGLTVEQTIALSTAFISQGKTAAEAGTRIEILARNLTNTTKTTKLLGAGFTALVARSPQEAIEKLMEAIAKGRIPSSTLNELLGETNLDFKLLSENGAAYAKILALVADKTRFAGSMQKEFEARAATTDNQLILLGNSVRNIGINLGSALLPVLREVAIALSATADKFADFFQRFPFAAEALGKLAAAFIAFKGVTLGLKLAQAALNIVMRANPIGLIVTAIAGLIIIGRSLADEFPIIGDIFRDVSKIFEGFGDVIGDIMTSIGGLFGGVSDEVSPLKELFETIFGEGAGPIEVFALAVRAALTPVIAMVEIIKRLAAADFTSISSIGEAFSGAGSAVLSFLTNESGVSPNVPPAPPELSGQMALDINFSGNTQAVQSVAARPIGRGNLGMNMNTVTP